MPMLAHQEQDYILSRDKKYFAFFWEMGLGKSKITIDTACHLYKTGEIDGVLIIAPKGVYLNWIVEEIPKHVPENIDYKAGYWNAGAKKSDLKETQKIMSAKDDRLDFLCINVEALRTPKGMMVASAFLDNHYAMMVVDESTSIKNIKAKQTKGAIKLSSKAEYLRILTGTPITNGPLDLFGQCEFLCRGCLGFTNYVAFKHYYAEVETIEHGHRRYEKIKKYLNLDQLSESLTSFSSRRLKEECVDLPEKTHSLEYVELTSEQERIYREIKEEAITMFSDVSMVTSDNVLTTLIKLHQVNCGHVLDDFGNMQLIKSNRLTRLVELTKETSGKIIIWGLFKQDIRMIYEALSKEYGQESVVTYYGETSDSQRKENLHRFKNDPQCRFFVSNESGSKGLTLIQSHYVLYFSYGYNLETYLQSLDRTHRIGQTKNVTYKYLCSKNTIDEKILKALREKKNIADIVLDNPVKALF